MVLFVGGFGSVFDLAVENGRMDWTGDGLFPKLVLTDDSKLPGDRSLETAGYLVLEPPLRTDPRELEQILLIWRR